MAKTKKVRTVAEKMEKQFTSALKKSTQEKNTLPVIVRNGVQVKMPLELVLMRASFSKIQLNIIVTVLKTIGNKVDEVINKKMKEGDIMSLFPDEEFGINPNVIKFPIKRKEFGIPSSHIEELKGALKLMRMIPVEVPIIGKVTGEKYHKYTNLCSIILPDDEFKDICFVEMGRDVAAHILHEDLRYATIVDSISRKLRSKYSIRIYWMVMLYAYNGGVTFKFEEFKKQVCGSDSKYERYPRFEAEVLNKAKKDIDDLYMKGLCEYCFEYHPTKEDRVKSKEKGNPETIIFTISKAAVAVQETKELDDKSFDGQVGAIKKVLSSEFGITRSGVTKIVSLITEDNIKPLKDKIAKLQQLKKEDPTKPGGFFATSVLNFFEEYNPIINIKATTEKTETEKKGQDAQESIVTEELKNEVHDQKYWRKKWYACQDEFNAIGYNIEQSDGKCAFLNLIQCLSYSKYDEQKKSVILIVPAPFLIEFIERNLEKVFNQVLAKHFGEGTGFDIRYEGFKGQLLAERAESVQKYSFHMDLMKSIEIENQQNIEKERIFKEKCMEAWKNCSLDIISAIGNDEIKDIFENHIAFESFDKITRTLLIRVSSQRIWSLLETIYLKTLSAAIFKHFGVGTILNYRVMG